MHLALTGLRGRLRLLAGMVRGNRPWRLVPHLSTATAAAVATSAYGIINTDFWKIADALSAPRLALIHVAAMASWLLIYNHLWYQPGGHAEREKAVLSLTTPNWRGWRPRWASSPAPSVPASKARKPYAKPPTANANKNAKFDTATEPNPLTAIGRVSWRTVLAPARSNRTGGIRPGGTNKRPHRQG
jgi:hypothetical protein